MADYGFATYNSRTQRREGEINSKYPIFGPEYNKIATQYKTYHLVDTYSQPITTASLNLPPVGVDGIVTATEYHAYVKTLIKSIPHGGKKIPLGYVTMTGRVVKNTKSSIVFTKQKDLASMYCDNFSLTANNSIAFPVASAVGQGITDLTSGGSYSKFSQNYVPYPTFPNNYPLELSGYRGQIIPGDNSSTSDGEGTIRIPYSIEVDSQNIKIYRWTYWCDIYTRLCMGGGDFVDVRTRTKAAMDYAGSSIDFTVYLCPYSMEDLI